MVAAVLALHGAAIRGKHVPLSRNLMRRITNLFIGALALATPFFFSGEAAAASLAACGNIHVEAEAECKVEFEGGCTAQCEPVNFTAACAADLKVGCDGPCNVSASAECTGSCQADCEGRLRGEAGGVQLHGGVSGGLQRRLFGSLRGRQQQRRVRGFVQGRAARATATRAAR
jgi:hypothetical protein